MSSHSCTFFLKVFCKPTVPEPSGEVVKELKSRFLLAILIHRTVYIRMRLEVCMFEQHPNDSYEYQDLKAMFFSIFI